MFLTSIRARVRSLHQTPEVRGTMTRKLPLKGGVGVFARLSTLIFVGARFDEIKKRSRCVLLEGATKEMIAFMENCAWIIDAGRAVCTLESDRKRELAAIEHGIEGGVQTVNKIVSSAVRAGKALRVGFRRPPPHPRPLRPRSGGQGAKRDCGGQLHLW